MRVCAVTAVSAWTPPTWPNSSVPTRRPSPSPVSPSFRLGGTQAMDNASDSAALDRMLAALNGAKPVPPTVREQGRPSVDALQPGQFDSVVRQRRSVRDFTGMSAQAADVAALLTAA